MHAHLVITGVLLIALAFVHLVFPSYFNWNLTKVSYRIADKTEC